MPNLHHNSRTTMNIPEYTYRVAVTDNEAWEQKRLGLLLMQTRIALVPSRLHMLQGTSPNLCAKTRTLTKIIKNYVQVRYKLLHSEAAWCVACKNYYVLLQNQIFTIETTLIPA